MAPKIWQWWCTKLTPYWRNPWILVPKSPINDSINEQSSKSSVSNRSDDEWWDFWSLNELGITILAPPRQSKYDDMTWIPHEDELSNNQPHLFDDKLLLSSSMNTFCFRLGMMVGWWLTVSKLYFHILRNKQNQCILQQIREFQILIPKTVDYIKTFP